MNEKYQGEIDEFAERFKDFKNAKIVLYGIGRYTATLLEGIRGFNFVGLMDKDVSRVGERIFDLPIIDKAAAEKLADIIVINTAETYWDVIYERIQDVKIPVYYKNGKIAAKKKIKETANPFKELSLEQLCRQIEKSEILSFDFFDTLFQRSVCNPRDVFALLSMSSDIVARESGNYRELRSKAIEEIDANYSLDELYARIRALGNLTEEQIADMKEKEIAIEKHLLIPRDEMLHILKDALRQGKEVYIISDMYLPTTFYIDVLRQYQISIPEEHILLSNVLRRSKTDGTLWEYYTQKKVKGKIALHIGDDRRADVEKPQEYGIAAYRAPNMWDMLTGSSAGDLASHICGMYDTAVMGCILGRWFRNPYMLEGVDNTVRIKTPFDMGYCVFAPVIYTFLIWLLQTSQNDHIDKLVFMSRDGYFLKEDFDYLCELMGEKKNSCYLGISRQLAMAVSIETKQDLMKYAAMPYSGTTEELLEDRLGIDNIAISKDKTLEEYLEEYAPQIERNLSEMKKNYTHYIDTMQLDDKCAVVDLGFYGNNQRYLNRFLHSDMSGYYFNANLSEQNENAARQRMVVCFQSEDDFRGEESNILKKQIYLESFLTAPYGMVKAVDEEGNFICADKRRNQELFAAKEEINRGVKQFICDYVTRFQEFAIGYDIKFVDWYYGFCFSGAIKFDDEIKRSFYNDNAMMNRIESMLFY